MSIGRVTSSKRAATCSEQLVADVVAEVVVDLLEAVEVDQQQRERVARARLPRQGVVEPVAEERSVGEAGQPVVEGLARELFLERHALADVAPVEHDAAHVLLVAQVGHVRLDVAPLAEAVA